MRNDCEIFAANYEGLLKSVASRCGYSHMGSKKMGNCPQILSCNSHAHCEAHTCRLETSVRGQEGIVHALVSSARAEAARRQEAMSDALLLQLDRLFRPTRCGQRLAGIDLQHCVQDAGVPSDRQDFQAMGRVPRAERCGYGRSVHLHNHQSKVRASEAKADLECLALHHNAC